MKNRIHLLHLVGLLTSMALQLLAVAHAETRAWLDRTAIGAGESVTLNIESDQLGSAPEYELLQTDFDLSGQTSTRQMQMNNGAVSAKALFGVVLTPRRSGALEIPALRVGREQTRPLRLQVAADSAPAPQRQGDERAFIETDIDDLQPYVQQSVGVVVRLYYATQLASGELVLDAPPSASLQRVGEDRTLVREVNGRRYNVVERRFLLVPDRSGPLQLPGARFNGRGVGGLFDDFFGRGDGRLSASAPAQTLQVRAQPADAPQPWLPLQDLRLRYTAAPQAARVGEAVTVEVEATATGATRAQFPELPVPSLGDAAQVFAEPAQYDETFAGGSPQMRMTRRYSIVPQQAGMLSLKGISIPWWDVAGSRARTTSLPDLKLDVAPGQPALAAPPVFDTTNQPSPSSASGTALAVGPGDAAPWLWRALAAGFALLWLLTLVWGILRGRHASAVTQQAMPVHAPSRFGLADLRRAIDTGGLDEVARMLCEMAAVDEVEGVIARLQDVRQREAIVRMQRARWGGAGDVTQARAALREAFRNGPHWRKPAVAEKGELDPLYPRRE